MQDDRIAVLTAASYLTEPARGDYNAYTSANSDFDNWAAMKIWLLQTYNPIDAENTYSVNWFYNLRQGDNESPDDYYRRFNDATNLLPHKLPDYYVRFHFAHTLVKYYKTYVLSDTELSKWEKLLDAIVSKMKRLPKPSSSGGEITRPSRTDVGSGTGTANASRFKKRKFTTPEPSSSKSLDFKRKKTIRDDTPLTDGERRFIDQNIARGGGIIVSEAVQNKVAWIKEAMERKLYIRCAGTGHILDECEATRQSNSWGSTSKPSLNAIFPGTEDLNEITQS
jgi:hypothetical protein